MPWRHRFLRDFLADRTRPRTHIFVRQCREWRAFAGAVTFRAFGIEDWCDVFRESDGFGGRITCARALLPPADACNGDDEEKDERAFHSSAIASR